MLAPKFSKVYALFFVVGTLLTCTAYYSFAPVILSSVTFGAGYLILTACFPKGGQNSRIFYLSSFCWFWFVSSLVAVYRSLISLGPDLDFDRFYRFATLDIYANLDPDSLRSLTDGSVAVRLWRFVYDFYALAGFDKSSYIGILINVTLVSFACALSAGICDLVYPKDPSSLNTVFKLWIFCPFAWLISSFHVRDSFALLFITLMTYYWLLFLRSFSASSFLFLISFSYLVTPLLADTREEYVFLAPSFAAIAIISYFAGRKDYIRSRVVVGYLFIVSALCLLPLFFWGFSEGYASLEVQQAKYVAISVSESSSDSLGVILQTQPHYIRTPVNILLMFFSPIPLWRYWFDGDSYRLIVSFLAVFSLFFLPLLIHSISNFLGHWRGYSCDIIFLVLLSIFSLLAVASTSGESRHLFAFATPLFVVSAYPASLIFRNKENLIQTFTVLTVSLLLANSAWIALKLFQSF